MKRFYLTILVSILAGGIIAQEATPEAELERGLDDSVSAVFRAESTTPLVGEPVAVTFEVRFPDGIELVEWPTIPEQWTEFISTSDLADVEIESDGELRVHSQRFIVRFWKPDDFSTPETFVGYKRPGEVQVLRIPVRPLFFSVPSILDRGDLNLRPYRGPVGMFYLPPWALVVIMSVAGTMTWYGRKRWLIWQEKRRLAAIQVLSNLEQAERDLRVLLETPGLPLRQGLDSLVDVLRRYLKAEYGFETQTNTTSELIRIAGQPGTMEPRTFQGFQRLMETVESLRYAEVVEVSDEDFRKIVEGARRWLRAAGQGEPGREPEVRARV